MDFSIGKILKGDRILWVVLVFLSLISLLIVYSATGRLAYREAGGNTGYYLIRQLVFLLLGFGVMTFLVNVIPVKFYTYIAPLLLMITIGALLAAIVQYKLTPSKPTPRSLDLGFLSFQPAELAKISLVMFVAKVLAKRQKTKEDLKKAFFVGDGCEWSCLWYYLLRRYFYFSSYFCQYYGADVDCTNSN